MIVYLLPLLIGYTGGKMVHNVRGGVVGAAAVAHAAVSAIKRASHKHDNASTTTVDH